MGGSKLAGKHVTKVINGIKSENLIFYEIDERKSRFIRTSFVIFPWDSLQQRP